MRMYTFKSNGKKKLNFSFCSVKNSDRWLDLIVNSFLNGLLFLLIHLEFISTSLVLCRCLRKLPLMDKWTTTPLPSSLFAYSFIFFYLLLCSSYFVILTSNENNFIYSLIKHLSGNKNAVF